MATQLVSAISIDASADARIWQGGARLVYAAVAPETPVPTQAVPRYIEDILNLTSYALEDGYHDFGATSEDGITLGRSFDIQDGINIDQRDYPLRGGRPNNFAMTLGGTSMDTSLDRMKWLWALGAITAISANPSGTPANAAQRRVGLGAPSALIERPLVVLQQNDVTGKIRMFFLRKARIASAGDFQIQSRGTTTNEFSFNILPDPGVTDGSDFGLLFELT